MSTKVAVYKKVFHETRRVGTYKPDEIIEFIDKTYPQFKGLCIYNAENKCLSSKEELTQFYFDPFHLVLEVAVYEKINP
jgi:hypothetical protein